MNYSIITGSLLIIIALTISYFTIKITVRNSVQTNLFQRASLTFLIISLSLIGIFLVVYPLAKTNQNNKLAIEQIERALSKKLVNYISVDNETEPKKGTAKLYNDTVIHFDIVKENEHYFVQNIKP